MLVCIRTNLKLIIVGPGYYTELIQGPILTAKGFIMYVTLSWSAIIQFTGLLRYQRKFVYLFNIKSYELLHLHPSLFDIMSQILVDNPFFRRFIHPFWFNLNIFQAPGFAYAWLEIVSHRVFIGRILSLTPQQKGWPMYAQLLTSLFKFLCPFLRNAELAKPVNR